ncbi:MAG: O-antigen ligase family protein [bacterium]|nr:O-antigen ligase family protein [bacterium]
MLNKLSKLFFWLFLISLPFGYRVLFFKFTPGFDEYEAIFLYASDVLMVLFLIFTIKNIFSLTRFRLLSIFLFLAGISIFFASYKFLALYNFIRLFLLVLTALAIAESLRKNWIKLETILAVLAGSAVFQSFIAFFQFLNQKSLGLKFLGESVLGQGIPGVAKIVIGGGKILRAYGTFPHPNVLAAFLLLGLFGAYYCFLRVFNRKKKFWLGLLSIAAIFIIILGLILAFSRTAWFLGIVLTLVFIFCLFRQKDFRRRNFYFSAVLFFIFLILLSGLGQLIFPRAQISLNEPAVNQRISYNELGWYLVKNHPLGVGLGNQVIYSVKKGIYQLFGMSQVWQWQPVHNIYLLIGSETGVLGLIVFLVFIAKLLIKNIKPFLNKISEMNYTSLVALIMFLSLLGFGLFDHFLWTLQPGRLMLWLVLGIMLGTSPRS